MLWSKIRRIWFLALGSSFGVESIWFLALGSSFGVKPIARPFKLQSKNPSKQSLVREKVYKPVGVFGEPGVLAFWWGRPSVCRRSMDVAAIPIGTIGHF